jgi:hypothetical protein
MLRNYLLILLVALLPIRSWASDSMGLSMTQSKHSMEMMADGEAVHCEIMESSSKNSDSQVDQHDNPTCNACSLCIAFAFAAPIPLMNINFYSHQLILREVLLTNSATLALPLKPPIL